MGDGTLFWKKGTFYKYEDHKVMLIIMQKMFKNTTIQLQIIASNLTNLNPMFQ